MIHIQKKKSLKDNNNNQIAKVASDCGIWRTNDCWGFEGECQKFKDEWNDFENKVFIFAVKTGMVGMKRRKDATLICRVSDLFRLKEGTNVLT